MDKTQAGVIISVPHASCHYHGVNAVCDSVAGKVGRYIYNDLVKHPQINSQLAVFDSDPIVDQNTKKYRSSEYRKQLTKGATKYLDKYSPRLIHLDVHSFDPVTNPDWANYEAVFIQDYPMDGSSNTVGLSYFISQDYKATTYMGKDNDIHQQMMELGIPSIIIEINEQTKDIKNIAEQVVDWLVSERRSIVTKGIFREIEAGLGSGLLGAGVGALAGGLIAGVPGAIIGGTLGGLTAGGIRSGVFKRKS